MHSCIQLSEVTKYSMDIGQITQWQFRFFSNTGTELLLTIKNLKRDSGTLEFLMPELQSYFKAPLKRFFIGIICLKFVLHHEEKCVIQRLYRLGGKGFQK